MIKLIKRIWRHLFLSPTPDWIITHNRGNVKPIYIGVLKIGHECRVVGRENNSFLIETQSPNGGSVKYRTWLHSNE